MLIWSPGLGKETGRAGGMGRGLDEQWYWGIMILEGGKTLIIDYSLTGA